MLLFNRFHVPSLLQATALLNVVSDPSEALLDLRLMRLLSTSCRRRAEALSTNAREFRSAEFSDALVRELGGVPRSERQRQGEGGALLRSDQWVAFGGAVSGLFCRPPALGFLLGSFDPEQEAERAVRAPRQRIRVRTTID